MKISFSTLGCPRWSWPEITATAVDLGYDGIEVRGVGKDISVPSIPAFSEDNLPYTMSELNRMKLEIACLDSDSCIHLRETEARSAREVQAYVLLAERLHVPYVRVMAAAPVPQPVGEVDEKYVCERAIALGEMAKQHGVKLLIETNGYWAESARLARLLSMVSSDAVGALWDIHHPYRFYGEKPADTLRNLQPWLCHTHLKDSVHTDEGFRYVLPGYGDVPLADAVSALKASGYDGYYSLEWVKRWDVTLEEPGLVFAHYANFMRTL